MTSPDTADRLSGNFWCMRFHPRSSPWLPRVRTCMYDGGSIADQID